MSKQNFLLRCPDCQEFTPLWEEVGKHLKNYVTVADLDCAIEKESCKSLKIDNYPTFISSSVGEILGRIRRERTVKQLLTYANKKFASRSRREVNGSSNAVLDISEKDFSATTAEETTLVIFCVSWCKQCQKIIKTLNEIKPELDDKIKMVRIDCSLKDNADVCFTEISNGVPTMNLYCNGKVTLKDRDELKVEELKDMMESGCGSNEDLMKWRARVEKRKSLINSSKNHQHV